MSNLCNVSVCAKNALDKMVCDVVSSCALDFYACIIEFMRNTCYVDLNLFFKVIALLSVMCWIQVWLMEMIKFVCKIPKFIKKIFCGKFNFCFLNCDSKSKSESKSKSKSECKSKTKHSCSSSSSSSF